MGNARTAELTSVGNEPDYELHRITLDGNAAQPHPDPTPQTAALSPTALHGVAEKSPADRDRVLRLVRIFVTAGVLTFFFLGIPLMNAGGLVADYKVNILGKYLCYCLVALGIDLIWGYTGMLSLCQALFFCLGGYAMAMHLSLPEGGGIYPVPQFLTFAYYGHADPLPTFWKPFRSMTFAALATVLVPATVATVFGFFIFRSRVRGVYFSIVTQAIAWGAWLLISRNEMLVGGTNGLTNFNKAFTSDRSYIIGLYLATLTAIVVGFLVCRQITRSRLGRVLVAIRDNETRLYFAGFKPYAFKVFVFAVAAALAGVAGALYAPQVGIITPQNLDVEASIFMVVLVAVGGRGRLYGAILGALVITYAMSALTSDIPRAWPFILGGIYIAVVLYFPDGLVVYWDQFEAELLSGRYFFGLIALLPLVGIIGFVLTEALGFVPNVLERPAFTISSVGHIQWKYLLLLGLLLLPAVALRLKRRTLIQRDVKEPIAEDHLLATERTRPLEGGGA